MKLFISGQGKNFSDDRELPPTMQRAKKLLDESKDGELFTSVQLSVILKVAAPYLAHQVSGGNDPLPGYSYRVGMRRYWGKPATIRQLKKETKS